MRFVFALCRFIPLQRFGPMFVAEFTARFVHPPDVQADSIVRAARVNLRATPPRIESVIRPCDCSFVSHNVLQKFPGPVPLCGAVATLPFAWTGERVFGAQISQCGLNQSPQLLASEFRRPCAAPQIPLLCTAQL